MVPEIGQFALILALLLALTQGILPIVGAARGVPAWMALARPAAQGQFTFVAIAFGCLAWSFLNNDFSVLNVATNSNSQLPLHYRIRGGGRRQKKPAAASLREPQRSTSAKARIQPTPSIPHP